MKYYLCVFISFIVSWISCSAQQLSSRELEKLKQKINPYVEQTEHNPEWLTSRLQMYWSSHATDVYIDGEKFHHAGGNRAPVPTVKLDGSRGNMSLYNAPRIEDIIPYDDDEESRVTFINKETGKMEKAHPSLTGRNIDALNRRIIGIAKDASVLYTQTGDKRYANLALPVFDTYMKGMYYRHVPKDINNAGAGNIVGMATFEVIHEDALLTLLDIYTNLKPLLSTQQDLYEATFKKWTDVIIDHGVPNNNWNLFQAVYIARVATTLHDDSSYSDHKGKQYYLDCVIRQDNPRQWSIGKLFHYGFDKDTHIWRESPGYSLNVLIDFAQFVDIVDRKAQTPLLQSLSDLPSAEMAQLQYMTPNRMFCGWGDSHPAYFKTAGVDYLSEYARRHNLASLDSMMNLLRQALDPTSPASVVEPLVSASFYAPNVSWLIQRSGMDALHDLSVSVNGSLGNHAHANGINMELYGKGYVLGPDGGIGRNLYSGEDYKQYYSQFPAHNTVCVDGRSSYRTMDSNVPFSLVARYPETNDTGKFYPVTFSVVNLTEPATNSEQQRTNAIVKTSSTGGYYVDIFRSRRKDGQDSFHDYFYHNLGQVMTTEAANRSVLQWHDVSSLYENDKMLKAYTFLDSIRGTETDADIHTHFVMHTDKERDVEMQLWMKGESQRSVYSLLSPPNLQYERMPNQPYDIDSRKVLTFLARQHGEAWNRPFVAIYEPSDNHEPSEIASVDYFKPKSNGSDAVGVIVHLRNGRTDYIFSSSKPDTKMSYKKMKVQGSFCVISDTKHLK